MMMAIYQQQTVIEWNSGEPVNKGYYLCAMVGNNKPIQLYWDGSGWFCAVEYDSVDPFCLWWDSVDNSKVLYYMKLNDIPMPENW